MLPLYLVALLHCVCFSSAGKTWTDAKDMRNDVENIVLQRAKFLQQQYEGVKEVRVSLFGLRLERLDVRPPFAQLFTTILRARML